jgi:Protein of unknown function (DUF3592)
MITPKNFWLFFGGIWLAVGGLLMVIGVVTGGGVTDVALPAVFAAVGGVILFKAVKKRKMEEELRRRGMPAEATITEVAPANIRINRVQQWAIQYRYQDAYGKSHAGSRIIAPEEAPRWQAGRTIAVRYDSQRPHLHVWMGAGP